MRIKSHYKPCSYRPCSYRPCSYRLCYRGYFSCAVAKGVLYAATNNATLRKVEDCSTFLDTRNAIFRCTQLLTNSDVTRALSSATQCLTMRHFEYYRGEGEELLMVSGCASVFPPISRCLGNIGDLH